MLFKGMEINCPAQGFSLQAAVLSMLWWPGWPLRTRWARFALPVCFSTQQSHPDFCSFLLCCTFPVDTDSFARAWETRFRFARIPGAETHKCRGRNLERVNHNLENQRAGSSSGTARITCQPYFQEKLLPLRSESIR